MQEVGTSQHRLCWDYAMPKHSLEYEFDVSISMHPARASVGRLTDDIKVRRELAMRAGKPTGCFTPAAEVEMQLFGGGIDGSFPVLLDFGYGNEVPVKRYDAILAFHDFELQEDGAITAWKSYGIGRGKNPQKADLDKLYKHSTKQTATRFPRGMTEATFADWKVSGNI
jgi:hypothetical protein